jgi:hypothetical protein
MPQPLPPRHLARALPLVVLLAGCGGGEKGGGGGGPVEPPPTSTPLVVSKFPTDTLRPGADLALDGSGFTASGMTVSVAGLDATVSSVTSTRVVVKVPAALPCAAPSLARVVVRRTAGSVTDSVAGQVPLDPVAARTLQAGERVVIEDAAALACTRLDGGGQYVVALLNTSTAAPGGIAVQLRGRSATTTVAQRAPRPAAPSAPSAPSAAPLAGDGAGAEHVAHLERERARLATLGAPPVRRGGAAMLAVPAVGDVLTLNAMYFDCAAPTAVRARVAAVGTRSVVLEDVAAASAGSRDAAYRALADEFDRVDYPLVTANFGDPLALDSRFGGDGHVRVLFTPYVSDSVPNTIGFMTGCNFASRSQLPSSNQAAVFYARLPLLFETTAGWQQQVRATLVHETKHLAAYAERFARAGSGNPVLEETWLEEATARAAEELYARTFSGATWKGNAGYATTLQCEVSTACDVRPIAMLKHFTSLGDYYSRVDSLTPIGRVSQFDQTFYGSGWLLVRWAADQFASDEATYFKTLTTTTSATGLANLALVTRRTPTAMLADWALALAVDDRPGFTPRQPELTIPSWNTRDVFAGLHAAVPFQFPKAFPLLERTAAFGDFTVDVPLLRSYTAAYVELTGAAGARQILSVLGPGGGAVPPNVALAVVRVQ